MVVAQCNAMNPDDACKKSQDQKIRERKWVYSNKQTNKTLRVADTERCGRKYVCVIKPEEEFRHRGMQNKQVLDTFACVQTHLNTFFSTFLIFFE